jgi:CRISPR/Cas system-associated protein Csx1
MCALLGVPADIRAKQNAMKAKNSAYTGDFTAMQEESTKASNITKDSVLVRTPSTILIQNISKQRTHTSKQLNDYVEALCEKINNKAPAYLDVDAHFNSVMVCYDYRMQCL